MGNLENIISGNSDIESSLSDLPDKVADSLATWRIKSLEREKIEAMLYLRFKAAEGKKTSDEIKSAVRVNGERYQAVLDEIQAESEYNRLYEKLMSFKRLAGLRTAF